MSLSQRLIVCAALVAAGAAAHYALAAHLASSGQQDFATLQAPLASFPAELPTAGGPALIGKDHPGREALLKQVPFADEVLYRFYARPSGADAFLLYAAYSRTGEDRKHHPEVCLREAARIPEDLSGRKAVPLGQDGAAQRFRFQVETGRFMHLYYWHCTLPRTDSSRLSPLQALHQKLLAASPSITLQVTTYATEDEDLARFETQVLPAIHAALKAGVLPQGCETGSARIPVTFLQR